MADLQVKHVPPELHEAVRHRAAEEGMSVSDYILMLLRRDLALPGRRQWFARLSEREPVHDVDIAVTLEEVRAARDDELLGR